MIKWIIIWNLFKKKKFQVSVNVDSKFRNYTIYTYYTNCDKFSKYLLDLSKITHAFTIGVFERLADQKTLANYGRFRNNSNLNDHFFQIYSYLSQRILHRENFVSKLWSSREVRRKRNNRDSRRVKNIWGLERSRRKQTGRSFVLVLYIVVFFFVLRNNDVSESVRCDQSHSWSRRLQRRWVDYFK